VRIGQCLGDALVAFTLGRLVQPRPSAACVAIIRGTVFARPCTSFSTSSTETTAGS
jgi:hypothetical protein